MKEASQAQEYERAARLRDDIGALTPGDGEAGGRARRRHRRRRRGVRPGRARGRRAGVLRARRTGARAARLGGRQGRRRRHSRAGRAVPHPDLPRRRRRRTARCRARSWCPSCPTTRTWSPSCSSCVRGARVSLRVPQRGDKRALLETVERNAKESFTRHKLKRSSDLTSRALALQELQDALGAAAGAAADRVLRRVQPAGHRGRRVDGRLRGRAAAQERIPPVRDQVRRRPGRRRLDPRGDQPAVPSLSRGADRDRRGTVVDDDPDDDGDRRDDRRTA